SGELAAGSKVRLDGTAAVELEVLEIEPPNTLTYRLPAAYGELPPHTGTLWVKPSLTGAEIDWIIKLDSERGLLGLGGPKRAAESAMKRALRALKSLVESESYRRPEVGGGERRRAWDDV
ncbi:MAG: SRPBCC family protein, partial [Actinobacteria bacterium]|nr:SRPBCC family protein [Actinomycetota bacterium]